MPWPRSRNTRPGGRQLRHPQPQRRSVSVATETSPPSTAVVTGSGLRVQILSAPFESWCGQDADDEIQIAGRSAARRRGRPRRRRGRARHPCTPAGIRTSTVRSAPVADRSSAAASSRERLFEREVDWRARRRARAGRAPRAAPAAAPPAAPPKNVWKKSENGLRVAEHLLHFVGRHRPVGRAARPPAGAARPPPAGPPGGGVSRRRASWRRARRTSAASPGRRGPRAPR